MADYRNEEINGRVRTTIELKPGEKIKLCRCQKSAEYPFCDGAHKKIDTTIGPAVIIVLEPTLHEASETQDVK